jgi:hypothetical protein
MPLECLQLYKIIGPGGLPVVLNLPVLIQVYDQYVCSYASRFISVIKLLAQNLANFFLRLCNTR